MKKKSILLILLPLVLILFSCSDAKKEYYANGKLKSIVHVRNGKYHGKALFYDQSGNLQLECFYKDNLLQGPLLRFFPLNKKKEEQNYDKGNLDGLCTTWYQDGSKQTETTYMNGVLNGPYLEFYPNNRLKIQGQYLKGFYTGRWFFYNFGGDLVGNGQFTHGTGKEDSFFSDGKVSHEVHFKDNLKEGEELEYDSTGRVTSIKIFKHDSLISSLKK